MYRGVIFDLDGTLVDSHAYTFAAVRTACQPYGVFPTDEEIYASFGPDERVILSKLMGPKLADEAYERLLEIYKENVHKLDLHPEIIRLLDDCMRAQIRLGLFTGRGMESTQLILEELGLRDFFRAIVSGDAAPDPKPSGHGVRSLLKQLGTSPHQCLLIGDSQLDVEAALDAGTDVLLATWFARGELPAETQAPQCSDPANLWKYIGLPRDH